MTQFELRLTSGAPAPAGETFFWTNSGLSSIRGNVGPQLGRLGAVSPAAVALVRIAVAVYAADQTSPRSFGGSDCNQREIDLVVPVDEPKPWTAAAADIASMLAFLSGDTWSIRFVTAPKFNEDIGLARPPADRVVLYSGGADSAVGGMMSAVELGAGSRQVLVSHYSASHVAPIQRDLAAIVERSVSGLLQEHEVFHIARRASRSDGTEWPKESSSRSRSFLFLALAIAVASTRKCDVWIPENGFASINPPLGPDRRGSLSTRTTHPAFIESLNRLTAQIGIVPRVINPYASLAKGEMFSLLAQAVGAPAAASYLSKSYSCAATGQRSFGVPLRRQCGVCFGCVVRRAAFQAAGLTDASDYIRVGEGERLDRWIARTSVEDSVRALVARGVSFKDLIALSLPLDYPLASAMDLCRRGLAELEGLLC
jgi:7-cyano-7-deazaguanine synthase in queuosine biosynthesis